MTAVEAESDCTQCPGGSYCEGTGNSYPTGECGEGYYCPAGSVEKEPADKFCPVGNFCPAGSSAPLPCRNNSHVSGVLG